MNIRLAAASLALAALLPAASHAAVITDSFADWSANAGTFTNTSVTGLPLFSTTSSIPLSNGDSLATSSVVTVLQPLSGWGPWSGHYKGDIFNTTDDNFVTSQTVTLTFSGIKALGFDLSPDDPLIGKTNESFIVTLSDGTTKTVPFTFDSINNPTQFVGFFDGEGVTSVTITVAQAPDFSFGNIDAAVPEPTSLGLFAAGFGLLGLVRRRRS
jgi:PEP-CTERM motif